MKTEKSCPPQTDNTSNFPAFAGLRVTSSASGPSSTPTNVSPVYCVVSSPTFQYLFVRVDDDQGSPIESMYFEHPPRL